MSRTVYECTSELFPVISLRDRIRIARETGIVEEAIAVPSSYDEGFDDYDPSTNIRESKLEMFESALSSSIDASIARSAQSSVVPAVVDEAAAAAAAADSSSVAE